MENVVFVIANFVFQMFHSDFVNGGLAPTWTHCNCSWVTWNPWSSCNSTCYGTRVRTRPVYIFFYDGCDEFTDCATRDMGSDFEGCNQVCSNGGTYNGQNCVCQAGFYGSCCNEQITCGSPSALTNGYVVGSSYTYGSSVTYNCNTNYALTDGEAVSTCQLNSTWSGNRPRCGYINSCSSVPCMNGATCNNIIDGYTCTCKLGWSGKVCEEDIQPPITDNCSAGINVTTEERMKTVSWMPPVFTDPMGHNISTQTNYPEHKFDFPWGDSSVQYTALKSSNGLSTECIFDVRIRPNPCTELGVPKFGARICNNWKTDYGLFCLVFCTGNYTLSRGMSYGDWYVCGASGNWMPSPAMPGCVSHTSDSTSTSKYRFTSCDNQTEISSVKTAYIELLKSSDFSYFCDSYSTQCTDENVLVTC